MTLLAAVVLVVGLPLAALMGLVLAIRPRPAAVAPDAVRVDELFARLPVLVHRAHDGAALDPAGVYHVAPTVHFGGTT